MQRYLVHVQVEGPTDSVTEQTLTFKLRDHGFTRFLTLDDGDVAPLGPWLYGGEAEDHDDLARFLCNELHRAIQREMIVLVTPAAKTYGFHTPGSIEGIRHLGSLCTSSASPA